MQQIVPAKRPLVLPSVLFLFRGLVIYFADSVIYFADSVIYFTDNLNLFARDHPGIMAKFAKRLRCARNTVNLVNFPGFQKVSSKKAMHATTPVGEKSLEDESKRFPFVVVNGCG